MDIGRQWVEIHREVAAAHYNEALKLYHSIKCMNPKVQNFFDLHDEESKKMNVGSRELYKCAIDIVLDLPLHLNPDDIQFMENRLAEMDEKYHFRDYEKTGAARWLVFCDNKKNERPVEMDSRYIWCTIFAHLWVVSDSIANGSYENEQVLDQAIVDATFVCAEFTGHHQKTFCYILLTLNALVAFLPAPFTQILNRFLEVLDSPPYNGIFPEHFIYRGV